MRQRAAVMVFTMVLAFVTSAHAAFDDELNTLQHRWAAARYEASGSERKKQLEALVQAADGLKEKYSNKADSYLWAGVIRGSLAEAINGISALSIVKEAKKNLERAIELDPTAEDAYAFGVLGLMYAKVPGWPIAFGDDKKAQELLKKGMEISPDGMNINYLYASYLFEQGDYKQAQTHIKKAGQVMPPAPADMWGGRKKEIDELAEKIQKKIK